MLSRSCWALLFLCVTAGFFGWLGLGTPPEELGTPPELGIPPHIPFEMTTGDDRFQAEATSRGLTHLDSCHCQVMVRLRSSCADLNEEEEEEDAAKLGVDLVNSPASAEGHRTYPCMPDKEGQEERPAGWLRQRLETPIHPSLQRPALDKTIITGGQYWVAQLMEDITQRMGNVSSRGAAGLREGHRVVLSDIHHTHEKDQDVYSQLESDLALLLAQQRRVEEVMEKLRQVNQSLGLMLATMEDARSQLENHLQHFHAILNPAGWSPSAISTCILHGSYFVLLVALLVPMLPRAILLLFFLASSALSELLGIPALSALLALAVAAQWLVAAGRHGAGGAWLVLPRKDPHYRLTSTPDREHEMELLQEELERMEMSCLQDPSCLEQPPGMAGDTPCLAGWVSPVRGAWRTKLSSCGVMLEPAPGTGKRWEPKPCSVSQSPASNLSLLSPRSPCQGLTKAGQRCRKKAIPGQDFCHVHSTG
ncbi:protein brambleberry-like isoform X2 [Aquila chrysaetos chrysaetos]|uniref:protein brambleberry-like isoform X2 n=1 Tax=Aquila chrysaetos chrysaetos TaxID=223781 RepID=UPI0011771DDE|nr:protein brambleberry-like isoform X2 [Aquila chrysaetos chrysaetos]